ncbi:unnamed protein product [Dracunculus medinensis]|uniref:ShKT domain-containing protein n=1 Tax=Dracunculus medinensis TaxID=318479 RepID=A0A0N4USA2_DRAME|nr:unnamed protein product [Dracunculus medinensis]
MFAVFAILILFSLLQEVQSGVGVALTQCIPNAGPARPVPPPSACRDKDPTVCTAVFAPNGADAADNADPTKDFLVNAYCLNATLKANAEEICPSSCAVCCLAPEFKCGNATTGAAGSSSCTDIRANCAQMSSYCNVPPYSTVMSQQCRRTCRLCT